MSVFRIRKIHDDTAEVNRHAIAEVQKILRQQFPGVPEEEVDSLPRKLRNPLKYRFRAVLFVAEDAIDRVRGFALVFFAPDLHACYLDFISAAPGTSSAGTGGALYERVREEALLLDSIGVFFECLPDDPALCRDPRILAQNRARLRFYEQYGARPIAGTLYETPVKPGGDNPPYLVYDGLGRNRPLAAAEAQAVVRGLLERKYKKLCPPSYIERVVNSFTDDPVRLRPPRYTRRRVAGVPVKVRRNRIALVVNDKHAIHHVKERGYVQSPVRISAILREIGKTGLFDRMEPARFSERHIKAVHDHGFVDYLRRACAHVPADKSVYPYVFPIRNASRPPRELPLRAGYYCIDTFTPLNGNAYVAARAAVDCALTAAQAILEGHHLAYSLVRPPGHHAERRAFGGFCYFNTSAVAAHFLSAYGPTCVLDIDYHHGNGTQDIFYDRSDVLTISIHGNPRFAYPYFSGFEEEKGLGAGLGYNVNYAMPEHVDGARYRRTLEAALKRVARFKPSVLIVALGLDPAKGDPTGSWSLRARDFLANGRMIGALGIPTLVVQEGGYRTQSLGDNARNFFVGLWEGAHTPHAIRQPKTRKGAA